MVSIFTKKQLVTNTKLLKPVLKEIKIQASEGSKQKLDIESLMLASGVNTSVPGITNSYTDYKLQTVAIYSKYNAGEDYGNQLVRTVVDFRTAFIGGEGISVSCKNDDVSDWIDDFLTRNKLNGSTLINLIKGGEMLGQSLAILDYNKDTNEIEVYRKPYDKDKPYRPKYDPKTNKLLDIQVKKENSLDPEGWKSLGLEHFVYIRPGGDDRLNNKPTTKTGIILTDIDNYDRCLKDIRRNNHIFARITPVFEVTNENEANALKKNLAAIKWKIGTAFIGKAKFKYETPPSGAHTNLTAELVSAVKTISAATGVPVHWLGFVELMSNRSTADSLYEMIKNSTLNERLIWEEALYDIILKAQELYINNGGKDITLEKDFEVKLPLLDFALFFDKVKALSMAYTDEAISIDDYRNQIPGINPLKTAKAIEIERTNTEALLVKMGIDPLQNKRKELENGEQSSEGK